MTDRSIRASIRALTGLAVLLAVVAPPGPALAEVRDAVARIRETGAIQLGYRRDAPPFSYRDENDAPAGLAVLLCDELANRIGAELGLPEIRKIWRQQSSRSRFAAIEDKSVDLHCGPTTQTVNRRRSMDFSIPYFIDGAGMVFRRGGAESLRALSSEPVGVLGGTTTEKVAMTLLDKQGATSRIIAYDSHVEGLKALQRGEIEAYFGDQSILYYQLGRLQPVVPLVISPKQYSFEPYALAMGRGESELRLLVDKGLSDIYRSGKIYDFIRVSLGRINLSELTEAVYGVVALPD